MIAKWPQPGDRDTMAERDWERIMDLVSRVRNVRSESNVEPGRWITAAVYGSDGLSASVESARRELAALARIGDDQLTIAAGEPKGNQGDVVIAGDDLVAVLPLSGLVDLDSERQRISRELEEALAERGRAEAQLGNESFIARAPEKVVQVQRERLTSAIERVSLLERRLNELDV
jgi:valyl-tRNA synthetase